MRIAIIDVEGCLVCFPRRMLDEGAEILAYVWPNENKTVGDNLIPKTNSLHHLLWWAKQAPTVAFFLGSGMGKAKREGPADSRVPVSADDFRRAGVAVIGGGSFCDRLEHDRVFGEDIAREIGCTLPPTHSFGTVADAISHVEASGDESWYFKTDKYINSDATCGGEGEFLVRNLKRIQKTYGNNIKNILQKKIDGVALSTAAWWNGRHFLRPFESTIEYKKAYNGNLGPATGCAANVVWFYKQDTPKIVTQQGWDKLEAIFTKYDAPPGIYDINSIAAEDGRAYFLEWTPRLGIDSEPTSTRLFTRPLAEVITKIAHGALDALPVSGDLAYAVRLGVPPYPFEGHHEDKGSALGTAINGEDGLWDGHYIPYAVRANEDGELESADRLGLVGLSLATGPKLEVLDKKVLDYAKSMTIQGLGYRTDALSSIKKDVGRMRRAGFEAPGALLE